jgi:hypothetical protein
MYPMGVTQELCNQSNAQMIMTLLLLLLRCCSTQHRAEAEAKGVGAVVPTAAAAAVGTASAAGGLRTLTSKDLIAAASEVSASISEDSYSSQELQKWNEVSQLYIHTFCIVSTVNYTMNT